VRQELEVLAEDEPRSRVKAEAVIAMLDDTLQTFASMLQIAELEAGATRQDFTPVNLRELTENLYQTYLPAAEECGQRMRLICEGEPVVQGSRSLLTQLLVNLLENAIRHSGAGSEIVLQAEEARDGTVLLSVRDNGRGVSEEEAQQLLKPFFRADRSRSTSGSGLGLSLVQAIASLHGATVSLQRLPVGLMIQLRFARG
jgi:signal transduction histidine kinase